jgi:hypothetical protein
MQPQRLTGVLVQQDLDDVDMQWGTDIFISQVLRLRHND